MSIFKLIASFFLWIIGSLWFSITFTNSPEWVGTLSIAIMLAGWIANSSD